MKSELVAKILKRFPKVDHSVALDFDVFLVDKREYFTLAEYLKNEPDLWFDHLSCLTGVDYPDYLEVVCHFYSYKHRHKLCVKSRVTKKETEISSLLPLWRSADWQEREAWEFYGIVFVGHPKLERLLTHDEQEGFPYRRDVPLENNEEWLLRDKKSPEDYGLPVQWES